MGIGTALMPRLGVRPLMTASYLGAAIGLLLESQIHAGSSYLGGVLPGMLVLALSFGLGFAPAMNAALHGVTGQDSSLASGMQGTMQQVGGALGLSCLVALAFRHAAGQISHGTPAAVAAAHGYALAFRVGAVLLVLTAALVLVLLERVNTEARNPLAETGLDASRTAGGVPSPARA